MSIFGSIGDFITGAVDTVGGIIDSVGELAGSVTDTADKVTGSVDSIGGTQNAVDKNQNDSKPLGDNTKTLIMLGVGVVVLLGGAYLLLKK